MAAAAAAAVPYCRLFAVSAVDSIIMIIGEKVSNSLTVKRAEREPSRDGVVDFGRNRTV